MSFNYNVGSVCYLFSIVDSLMLICVLLQAGINLLSCENESVVVRSTYFPPGCAAMLCSAPIVVPLWVSLEI